jgi:hypothetical protein
LVQNSNVDYTTLNPGSTSRFAAGNLLRGYGKRTSGVTMAMNGFASNAKNPSRLNTALYATATPSSDEI